MGTAFGSAFDRRAFLKASAVAGISVVVRPLAAAGQPQLSPREVASGSGWKRTAATAARRIDGWPKVSGAKLYASDFRPVDMPGWPRDCAHALLLKTPDATHVFEGIDLSKLDPELRPDRVVLAGDLVDRRDHRADVLRRRSALSGRQDAALSRPAGRAPDLE